MKRISFTVESNIGRRFIIKRVKFWLSLLLLLALYFPTSGFALFKSFVTISCLEGGFTGEIDDYDNFGEAVAPLGDLDGDGIPDIAVSADLDDDGGENRGAVYILFLNSDGTVKSHTKISSTSGGFTGSLSDNDHFGRQVGTIGDVDGDGIVDIAVMASHDTTENGERIGAIWILFLNSDGTVKAHQKINSTEGGFTGQLDNRDAFGGPAGLGIGDFDGDGVPDLAVGVRGDDDGGSNRGAVYILFLNSDGTVKSHTKISSTSGGFTGILNDGGQFGQEVESLGDFDGDGITDIAVSGRKDDDCGEEAGALWLLMLNTDGTVKSHLKISCNTPGFEDQIRAWDVFTEGIGNLGDLDGNGVVDLAVGADYADDEGLEGVGAVWILFLNQNGTVRYYQKISASTPGFGSELYEGYDFGNETAGIGDLDGDGVMDLLVSSNQSDEGGPERGSLHVFLLENAIGIGSTYAQLVSTAPDRSNPIALDGATVEGLIYVFVEPTTDVKWVDFYIDGVLHQTENYAPYDLAGGAGSGLAAPFDTEGLSDGPHTFSARITKTDNLTEAATASVLVANNAPALVFNPEVLTFIVEEDGIAPSQSLDLNTSNLGDASYTITDDATWLTVTPTSGTTPDTLTVSIDATGLSPGTYTATITATSGGYTDDIVDVTLYVTGSNGPYQQDSGADGVVSIEAENFDANVPQGGHDWIQVFPAGYSGSGAMQALPNLETNNNTGYVTNSPRLDFVVNFVKTGIHYVWLRGLGASGSDDSVHVGLDGIGLSTSDRIGSFNTNWTWSKSTMDGSVATINVSSAGVHTVNVWMREDGFVLDKLVLTVNASYTPSGEGPAESPRGNSLVFDPDVLTFTVEEGETTSSQTTDLDTSDSSIATYTISDDAAWLLVTPTSGDTADSLTVSIDATGLTPGTYTGTITATSGGYVDDTVAVTLYVSATSVPELVFTPDVLTFTVEEGGSASFQNTVLSTSDSGDASYTITDDATWLTVDPPSGTTTPDTLTVSIDATGLSPGLYTATITATSGGYVDDTVDVTLFVTAAGIYDLLLSSSPDRSNPVSLEGETVTGNIYVFTSPDAGVSRVSFYLDDPGMSGSPIKVENYGPYDFAGTGSGDANPYNTGQLLDGLHEITALIDLDGGGSELHSSTFTLANNTPALVFNPDVLTFVFEEDGTTPSQSLDLDTSDSGVASYTITDDATWLTVTPTSGATPDTLTVSIDATGLTPGTYTGTITATSGGYVYDMVDVTLFVTGSNGPYQQDPGTDGIVSIEVENFDVNMSQGGHDWVPVFPAGYSGSGAMQALPNLETNNNTGYELNSPRLDFIVNFVKTGTHYVWIRGLGASGKDDSVHVGLDGIGLSTSDRMGSFNTNWTWSKSTMDGPVATINVSSAGVHTVNVWMREDGFVLDKLVLTVSGSYTPTGEGPAESPR